MRRGARGKWQHKLPAPRAARGVEQASSCSIAGAREGIPLPRAARGVGQASSCLIAGAREVIPLPRAARGVGQAFFCSIKEENPPFPGTL